MVFSSFKKRNNKPPSRPKNSRVILYAAPGVKFDNLSRQDEKQKVSRYISIDELLKPYRKRPPPPRPTMQWIHVPTAVISDENDDEDDAFDWSAGKDELLKIAQEIGIPKPDSEESEVTMQRLKKNIVFITLHMSLKNKRRRLLKDSSLGPVLEKIQTGGPDAMKRYWDDKDVLLKLASALRAAHGRVKCESLACLVARLNASIDGVPEVYRPDETPLEYDFDDVRMRLFLMMVA